MNIDELKDEKIAMENRLKILIEKELRDFQINTGTSIKRVSVGFHSIGVFGSTKQEFIVDSVCCEVDL